MTEINFFQRPIAITDLEMTGLDPHSHEIIEIGLIVVRQPDLKIIDTLDIKVRPEHIETATPEALKVNGYRAEDWTEAIPLSGALELYAQKTAGAIFCAQTINNDWPFLAEGFYKTGVRHSMDYHMIDIPSIAWIKLRFADIEKVRLSALCKYFDIVPEPEIHRAMNGAKLGHEVLKKLIEP